MIFLINLLITFYFLSVPKSKMESGIFVQGKFLTLNIVISMNTLICDRKSENGLQIVSNNN